MPLTKKTFFFLLSACFLVMLINLNKIPIAWTDEIMLLDPAYNLLKYGKYIGKVWPHAGAEQIFLAYLPLASWIHLIDLSLFPHELFYTRLIGLICLATSCLFLYKYLDTRYHYAPQFILFLVLLFVLDEGINNSFRSGRVEVLEIALLTAVFYLNYKRSYPYIQVMLLALLSIAHPAVYPVILILTLQLLMEKRNIYRKISYLMMLAIPMMIYLAMARFDFNAVYQQLILHGKEHDQTAVQGNIFYLHFIERFLPTYKVQPYLVILNLLMHILCIYNIIVRKGFRNLSIEWCFLATSIFWFFVLAPFYRYTPILSLMIFLLLPDLLQKIIQFCKYTGIRLSANKRINGIAMFLLLGFIAIPFIVRNTTAFLQAEERNEYAVYHWLDQHISIKDKPVLIVDEGIAFFYAINNDNVSYTLPYAVKKYRFEDYSSVYYLTHREAPQRQTLIGTYGTEIVSKHLNFIPLPQILTYKGMRLYRIESRDAFQALQRGYQD